MVLWAPNSLHSVERSPKETKFSTKFVCKILERSTEKKTTFSGARIYVQVWVPLGRDLCTINFSNSTKIASISSCSHSF